ncbi:hypothetical protein LD85_3154 (plasmid) [Saccharolobus islandicus L.D.8.5]|uniref:Uncharacterized protein n=2 Tax=Saccharolobus islandicus TaxID=43080 RepID=D2PKB1_SACI9|nr:hypothetical protein LD85_3154 [Sulfolobus islandicus L.D.8.5]
MKMKLIKLLKEVADENNLKLNILDNGVIIIIKEDKAILQIAAVRDVYYIRYMDRNGSYILRKLDKETIEKILNGEVEKTEAIKIPDV